MKDHKAPGGASSTTLPVAPFAYEVLDRSHVLSVHFDVAMEGYNPLRARYKKLDRAIKKASRAIADLYQVAGEVWHAEAKRAEGAYDPAVTAALEKAVDAVRAGFTGGAYSKTDSALDAAALRVRALLEPPCTQTD